MKNPHSCTLSEGYEWEGAQAPPARQHGISFLNHPSPCAQAVILQMSHSMNPVLASRHVTWYIQPIPLSLSEGWAMHLSLLSQPELGDLWPECVPLFGIGRRGSHSFSVGMNYVIVQGPSLCVHRKMEKVEGLGVFSVGGSGAYVLLSVVLSFISSPTILCAPLPLVSFQNSPYLL